MTARNMSLYQDHIKKLGLPEYIAGEKHINYVQRALLNGHRLDTRKCRYIGIGNLHSLVSKLARKQFPHSLKHDRVIDPHTGEIPVHLVDVIWMSMEQLETYKQENAQPKPSV